MHEALERRGLVRALKRDPRCIFQWSERSRINWKRITEQTMVGCSYYMHRGLAHKADLMEMLHEYASGKPETDGDAEILGYALLPFRVARGKDALIELLNSCESGIWVLKASTVNNACNVHVFEDPARILRKLDEQNEFPGDGTYLLQAHVDRPLLIRKCKFHIRANVLAAGRLDVYLHQAITLKVACKPFVFGDWDDRYMHITNHGTQKNHESFEASKHHLMLEDMDKVAEKKKNCNGDASLPSQFVRKQIQDIVGAVFRAAVAKGMSCFFPMQNCFEVFGFDFMVRDDFTVCLLEINSGPALFGNADKALCSQIIDDTLRIVLDPWIDSLRPLNSAPRLNSDPQKRYCHIWSMTTSKEKKNVVFAPKWTPVY